MKIVSLTTVDELHDAFMALGRAYRAAPSRTLAEYVETAYRRFYVVYTGSASDIEPAIIELRRLMARTLAERGAA